MTQEFNRMDYSYNTLHYGAQFSDILLLIKSFVNNCKLMTPFKHLIDFLESKQKHRHTIEQILKRRMTSLTFHSKFTQIHIRRENILELYIYSFL